MTIIWNTIKSYNPKFDAAVLCDCKSALVSKLIFLSILALGDRTYLRFMKVLVLVMAGFLT
jgi:hypothetical protein